MTISGGNLRGGGGGVSALDILNANAIQYDPVLNIPDFSGPTYEVGGVNEFHDNASIYINPSAEQTEFDAISTPVALEDYWIDGSVLGTPITQLVSGDLFVIHVADGVRSAVRISRAALPKDFVTERTIQNGAVTTDKIADDAVTSAKLGQISSLSGFYGNSRKALRINFVTGTGLPNVVQELDIAPDPIPAAIALLGSDLPPVVDSVVSVGGELVSKRYQIQQDDNLYTFYEATVSDLPTDDPDYIAESFISNGGGVMIREGAYIIPADINKSAGTILATKVEPTNFVQALSTLVGNDTRSGFNITEIPQFAGSGILDFTGSFNSTHYTGPYMAGYALSVISSVNLPIASGGSLFEIFRVNAVNSSKCLVFLSFLIPVAPTVTMDLSIDTENSNRKIELIVDGAAFRFQITTSNNTVVSQDFTAEELVNSKLCLIYFRGLFQVYRADQGLTSFSGTLTTVAIDIYFLRNIRGTSSRRIAYFTAMSPYFQSSSFLDGEDGTNDEEELMKLGNAMRAF